MNILIVKSCTGRDIEARILRPGDSYGLNGGLIWGTRAGAQDPESKAMMEAEFNHRLGIEFDDLTSGEARFISRYYLSTFLQRNPREGLCLEGGDHDLDLSWGTVAAVTDWVKREV